MLNERTIPFFVAAALWVAASICSPGATEAGSFRPVAFEPKDLQQVKVHRLIVDPTTMQPVVFLADSLEERALRIWIGHYEANAIYSELQGIKHRRPLTHDLIERIIQKTNGTIHRIIITHCDEGIYYATIVMETGGSFVEIDARPSDSIVVALKFKAPLFVSNTLFKDMAVPLEEQEEIEEQYGLVLQELNASLAEHFSFESTRGVLVSDVREDSRAEKDGIKRGDIFVAVGGQTIGDVMSLKDAFARSEASVQAKIFRKDHFLSVTLHLK